MPPLPPDTDYIDQFAEALAATTTTLVRNNRRNYIARRVPLDPASGSLSSRLPASRRTGNIKNTPPAYSSNNESTSRAATTAASTNGTISTGGDVSYLRNVFLRAQNEASARPSNGNKINAQRLNGGRLGESPTVTYRRSDRGVNNFVLYNSVPRDEAFHLSDSDDSDPPNAGVENAQLTTDLQTWVGFFCVFFLFICMNYDWFVCELHEYLLFIFYILHLDVLVNRQFVLR